MDTNRHIITTAERSRGGKIAAANARRRRMETRLATLDCRYDRIVDAITEREMPAGARLDQAFRNLGAGRRRRKGQRGLTVRQEARAFAETRLLQMLDCRAGDPMVDQIQAEIDEACAIRESLEALQDATLEV